MHCLSTNNWIAGKTNWRIKRSTCFIIIIIFPFFRFLSNQTGRKESERAYGEEKCRTWSTRTTDQRRPWWLNWWSTSFLGIFFFPLFLLSLFGDQAGNWILKALFGNGNKINKKFTVHTGARFQDKNIYVYIHNIYTINLWDFILGNYPK